MPPPRMSPTMKSSRSLGVIARFRAESAPGCWAASAGTGIPSAEEPSRRAIAGAYPKRAVLRSAAMTDAELARELSQRVQALERRVQRLEAREGLDAPATEVSEDEIVALLQQNKKVEAVKLYSELTGA